MKTAIYLSVASILLLSNTVLCQPYKRVIYENSSVWYLAHAQLSGRYIDTIFAGNFEHPFTDLYYRGEFYNGEMKYAGKVRSSEDYGQLWYTDPENEEEILIYDLSLEKDDSFVFLTAGQANVDTVYYQDNRKIIEFDIHTDWDEPFRFIEGVGPNISLVSDWKDPGMLSHLVVCLFEDGSNTYSNSNENFFNCDLNTSKQTILTSQDITIYPNPFDKQLRVNLASEFEDRQLRISIFTISGKLLYSRQLSNHLYMDIDSDSFLPGIYLLNLKGSIYNENYKIIKL